MRSLVRLYHVQRERTFRATTILVVFKLLLYKHLKIRNATPERCALYRRWNDGKVMAHAGFPNGLNTTTEKTISELSADSFETYRRLIMDAEDIPIGEMSFRKKGGRYGEI